VIGGWVVFAAMFVVAAQMGQTPDAARIAFGVALFVVAPALLWLYVCTCRMRLDEWGLSRRQLGLWTLWPWESFAAGEISFSARKAILSCSHGPIWSRWILLGFFSRAENEFLLAALKRVIPPDKWQEGERLDLPAEGVREAVLGLVLTRKLRLNSEGCTLLWQGDELIRWEQIDLFRIAKSEQKDLNVFRLEIHAQHREPLRGHLNYVALNGKSVGSLARGEDKWHDKLREIVPARCWQYFRASGELQSIEEGEYRIAEGRKKLKMLNVFWVIAALTLPLAGWIFIPGMFGLWNNPFFPFGWKIVALICTLATMFQPSVTLGALVFYLGRGIRESIAETQAELQSLFR
jgi:hypothetical protein